MISQGLPLSTEELAESLWLTGSGFGIFLFCCDGPSLTSITFLFLLVTIHSLFLPQRSALSETLLLFLSVLSGFAFLLSDALC